MSIVGKQYQLVGLNLEVEATNHSLVSLHALSQLFCCATIELCHGHSSHSILYIDRNGLS